MRSRQSFGGSWTEDKLERLRKYLKAYLTIFQRNVSAQFFTTVYVDAFAGTGYIGRRSSATAQSFPELAETETQNFLKGSTRVALDIQPGFDQFLFIETGKSNVRELEQMKAEYPEAKDKIRIERADANQFLKTWCATTDWTSTRAVLFLDPFGMEVEWSLLEAIAATGGIDVWLLFPFGGISRHLTRSEPPPAQWADRLTRILGTDEWLREFYPATTELTLFGEVEQQTKDADFDRIAAYVVRRLRVLFPGVADNPLPLRNSRNTVLFLFCFATASRKETARAAALRIASNILKR